MTDHWRIYTPIDGVLTFDADGEGPVSRRLNVTANMHRSELFPERQVRVGVVGVGLLSMTPGQSADLRAQLERAERDVAAGVIEADLPDVEVGCG